MLKRFFSLPLLIIVVWSLGGPVVSTQEASLSGTTLALVNLRSGPGTRFDVVQVLPPDLPVTFVGRNASSTWLLTLAGSETGWVSYTFVNVRGSVNVLPVINGIPSNPNNETSLDLAPPPLEPEQRSFLPGVVPHISMTTRQIFLRGQELGNNPDVFAKVGDSITASVLFLAPFNLGNVELHDYEYLEPVIDFFSRTPARDHYSFANTSVAARGGWSTFDVLDPDRNVPGLCHQNETPLTCEYRVNRPAISLIMLGTNDLNWVSTADYRANMETIVQVSIDHGVIPVLSTIPDQPISRFSRRVAEFNEIIMDIAFTYDIPLWNYWLALQDLPNRGLSDDSIHPSYDYRTQATAVFTQEGLEYGYNMRNLTALMVLDAIWRGAMY